MNLIQKQAQRQQIISEVQSQHTGGQIVSRQGVSQIISQRQRPNLLRINADNQQKKFIIISIIILLAYLLVVMITAALLPDQTIDITNRVQLQGTNIQNCNNPNEFDNKNVLKCGAFTDDNPSVGLVAGKLKSLNQFLVLNLILIPKIPAQGIRIDDPIQFTLFEMQRKKNQTSGVSYLEKSTLITNESLHIVYDLKNPYQLKDRNGDSLQGYNLYLGFLEDMTHKNIYINALFRDKVIQLVNIKSIEMQAFKIAASFTVFTIVIRYLFFAIALFTAFFYYRKYKLIPEPERITEQKMIWILSILLLFFNDPLFPITILKQNMFSSFLSSVFVLTFLVYLVFLWSIFMGRILYQEDKKQTQLINKFKIGYAIIVYILLIVLYMLLASYRINEHPLIGEEDLRTKKFYALEVVIIVLSVIAFAYLMGLFFSIICKLQQLRWRNILFMMYSSLFVLALFVFFIARQSFSVYNYNASIIMTLYGFMNFYVWYLQFMYTPTNQNQQIIQKNLLNSDDRMTIATIQFNDLSINLDDGYELPGKREIKQSQLQEQKIGRQKFNEKMNSQFNQNEQYKPISSSGIELQNQIKKQKEIDFFDENLIQKQKYQKKQEKMYKQQQDGFGDFSLQ